MTQPGDPRSDASSSPVRRRKPRLSPIPEQDLTQDQRELIESLAPSQPGRQVSGWLRTMVRNPGALESWIPTVKRLYWGSCIPERDRELIILRTGWLCRGAYEWGQHVRFALAVGVTHDEVERVVRGPDDPQWTEFDAALVRGVDELHYSGNVDDRTWDVLAGRYRDDQLIEYPMLVGHYHAVAWIHNALGVESEPGADGLDAR